MSYNQKELEYYRTIKADLIPIHTWNKKIKGKNRGKTPIDSDWVNKLYKADAVHDWIKAGYNLGYRIQPDRMVIDMDPRNYQGEDIESKVANLLDCIDFDDVKEQFTVVKTGGNGWHIYLELPEGVDYKLLKETVESLPGVEFKHKGKQVLCAGSKHCETGNYYKWINKAELKQVPKAVIKLIQRKELPSTGEYVSGKGALSGEQLRSLILDKLDIDNYGSNDLWFPLLCASHHATDGKGIEEFVDWSVNSLDYSDDENTIRNRWQSLDNKKDNLYTIGTLIRELDNIGEDSTGIKAVLSFNSITDAIDNSEEDESEEETQLINKAKELAEKIDINELFDGETDDAGVEGKALEAVMKLSSTSHQEEVMKCLRLIKAASTYESAKAQELLVDRKILKQTTINKILRKLEDKISDDLALVISRKSLEVSFNKGKHLINTPSGILYAYKGTHWIPISDEFLSKLVQTTLHKIKEKIEVKAQEVTLIQQAVKLSRIQVSTLKDRIHSTNLPASVINCKNGELWLDKDGSHKLKPHNYKTYLLTCLSVDYNPNAQCPLFMQTIRDIFRDYPDTEDMVRHLAEILGYIIQPYKNIASWWLFRGPGGDGKSTILKILGGILQNAQLMTTIKILSSGTENGNNHAMNSLIGKLAVVIEELPSGYLLKDAGLKMLSENTKMEANPKGKEAFDFMYAGNVIMCSNGFPAIRDLSRGMARRANILPFNRMFELAGEDDINRAVTILNNPEEMSGVLNFMLEGLQRLRDRGKFMEPVTCKAAKEEWMGEANNVVRFLKETVIRDCSQGKLMCDFSVFYDIHYQLWCQENSIDDKLRKSKQHFKRDLIDLGLIIRLGGGNTLKIYGARLIRDFNDMDEF